MKRPALRHHAFFRLVLATASLIVCLAPATAQTQTQRGVARMITRSKTDAVVPVSGVRVVVGNTASKASDARGRFTLNVTKNKVGSFQLKDVRVPQGSALILASPRRGDNCYLNAGELVLAFTTAEDKQRAYKASYDKLQAKYDQQSSDLQQLRNKLRRQTANLEEGTQAYKQLKHQLDSVQAILNQYFDEKQQDNITKELQRIAEQLAVTDYQSLDSLAQRIYELKAEGDWPTLSKLLLDQMRGDAAAYIKESVEQKKAAKAVYDRAAQELAHRLDLLRDAIEAFKMQHLNDSVSRYYEILIAADTANFDEICNAGMFELEYTAHYDRARTYFEQSLRCTDIDTLRATAYNNLGLLFRDQGDYARAAECHQNALKIRLDNFGEQHPDVARTYNNLGLVYYHQGDYARAEEYIQKSLMIRLNILGEQHRDVAGSYNNLGTVFYAKRDYARAGEYYQKANKIMLDVLDEQHPDVATSYSNLGIVCSAQDNDTQAEAYYKKALEIQRAIFGEQHPNVAITYNNLGGIYYAQRDTTRAAEYFKKALDIQRAVFGEQHPVVAHSYNNLGALCLIQRDTTRAEDFFEKALKIQRAVFGEQHPEVAHTYNNLGRICGLKHDYAQAAEYFQKALDIAKSALGTQHASTKLYQKNLDSARKILKEQK